MKGAPESTFSEINNHFSIKAPTQLTPGNTLNSFISLTNLFSIIFKKLHPLFSVDCVVTLVYDEQLTVIKEAYISTYNSDTDDVHAEVTSQPFEFNPLQKTIAELTFPVIKSMDEWIDEENTNHHLLNGEHQYKYHCYIPLETNNKILGTLELHNNTRELSPECLTFCSSIADLLAEVIYLQHSQLLRCDSQVNINSPREEKSNYAGKTLSTAKIELLSKLNEQFEQLSDLDTLDEFINRAAELFPLGYEKIKAQLAEIKVFKARLETETVYVTEDNKPANNYPEIIGAGPSMSKVFALMNQVADSESTVLILGESGTGKELIARAIHEGSVRKDRAMIKVNCAAIPTNLIESELFGHEKGSFTGATDKRIGKFELANNSTLFLDEIGELPLDLQVKLLRVLQEKETERVGGKTIIKTDVRIISATNRDLLVEVEKGRFRLDLYYRLHVFPIYLPPLRERLEDIPLLATYFLNKYGKQQKGFSQRAIKQMINYSWPGNVREMEHLVERQALLSTKPVISEINIPTTKKTITDSEGAQQKVKTIDENERDHIFTVLQLCNGRISGAEGAAKLLGVPATTLNSKIKRLGISKTHF
jgi:transcriptional regulator with GAF, ATPase, and Fis domain